MIGRPPNGRGFTMVEVIVVVVILAVMAGLVVPRLVSMGGREARASAYAAGDLISAAARRDSLTSQRVAIEFNPDNSRLSLMTLETPSGDTTGWHEDRLMPRVDLGDTKVEAWTDGVALDARGWRVEFPQGSRRPGLELLLTDARGKEHWRVELPSSAAHAAVMPGNELGQSDQTIDLDAAGGGTAPW